MRAFLVIVLHMLIIGLNVRVGEAAPAMTMPGYYMFKVPCGLTSTVNAELKDNYREQVLFRGLAKNGIMKFWANEEKNTFTVGVEMGALTCLVTSGEYLVKEASGTPL